MVSEEKKKAQKDPSEAKKPYRKPRLQIYGDLSSITKAVTGGKKTDHFTSGPSDKT